MHCKPWQIATMERTSFAFVFRAAGAFLGRGFLGGFSRFLRRFRGFAADFLADGELLPPEKMLSQLSEYCFVAPMRTTLMGLFSPGLGKSSVNGN